MTSTFIGIDLAWAVDRNHSGIAVLRGDQRGARLASVGVGEGVVSLASIVEFVREHSTASTVVAVDAPRARAIADCASDGCPWRNAEIVRFLLHRAATEAAL